MTSPFSSTDEDRMRDLEGAVNDCRISTAVTTERVDALTRSMNDGFTSLKENFSEFKEDLSGFKTEVRDGFRRFFEDAVPDLAKGQEAISGRVGEVSTRVGELEKLRDRKLARAAAAKKALWALLLAVVGAFAKGVVDALSKR